MWSYRNKLIAETVLKIKNNWKNTHESRGRRGSIEKPETVAVTALDATNCDYFSLALASSCRDETYAFEST